MSCFLHKTEKEKKAIRVRAEHRNKVQWERQVTINHFVCRLHLHLHNHHGQLPPLGNCSACTINDSYCLPLNCDSKYTMEIIC